MSGENFDEQFASANIGEKKKRKRKSRSLVISDQLDLTNLQNAKEMEGGSSAFKWMNPSFQEAMCYYGEEPCIEPSKKQRSTCIAPTMTGTSSFSVIHLLCAVRTAFITPLAKNNSPISGRYLKGSKKKHRRDFEGVFRIDKPDACYSGLERFVRGHLPSLTTRDIVQRVRLNPRDFHILEAKEPLEDLVSGVLKVFSTKTAPVGVKSWKSLAAYEKSNKSWSWIGPLPSFTLHGDRIVEETSPEAWGLSRKTLVKMVDSFAYWLKERQEMLQKISSLPRPPQELMQFINFSERLKESRAVRSLRTINPCCEEVRAYFHREEALRYALPDRAFSYTAIDGRKSSVAPLIRCSGKPSIKARDHHILKHNRPPHFTVLCLVRDAAARLPGGVGTRADICVLVRDSQFIVEDISDVEVNQVISGALDRLHYENDPCVKFEKKWRLWAYLHGDRQEDFEYDSSCTVKSRKWAKKKL